MSAPSMRVARRQIVPRRPRHRRDGTALLAVLWVLVGAGVIAAAASLAARQALGAARNRASLARAQWRAEECLERARATVADSLAAAPGDPALASAVWRDLDRVLAAAPILPDSACVVTARAAGAALDVNVVDEAMLRALFAATGLAVDRADSLADALLDWRDADDLPRPRGAERAWYRAQGRLAPRDGPLADRRELGRVRGFERPSALDTLLDVEPGRVALGRAPLPVLAALPGMTPEALARVGELRLRGVPVTDLLAFAGTLSPAAREALLEHYAELVRLTTPEPDAWLIESRGTAGVPEVSVAVEVRLVRGGSRAAVVRRRMRMAESQPGALRAARAGAP